jgi:hypothetical protein
VLIIGMRPAKDHPANEGGALTRGGYPAIA